MTDLIKLIAGNPCAFSLGLLVALLMGFPIKWMILYISRDIDDNPPEDFKPPRINDSGQRLKIWQQTISNPSDRAGAWLGSLERIVFFLLLFSSAQTIILGWLAFKLGSKWEVWQNIVKVPDAEKNQLGVGPRSRRAWGSRVLQRFLIGTLSNLLAAMIGVGLTLLLIGSP